MKATIMGLISMVDEVASDQTPTKRVLTWIGSIAIGAFGLGVTAATWVGLPNDVRNNTSTLETLAQNQIQIVRLITSQECDRRELTNRQCRQLQRTRLNTLKIQK